jgi:guanosine-3',5'-bis(diphosphate) 3'-pyrophosphohydrolase
VIHGAWTPLQERIKDYIASPKSNGYQSLHTTIFGPRGTLFEIQIRTREMHRTAEYGIAAHWLYKEGEQGRRRPRPAPLLVPAGPRTAARCRDAGPVPRVPEARPVPGRDLRLHAQRRRDPAAEGCDADRLRLRGAHRGRPAHQGARVNGRIVPLSRELRNSETVEIIRSPNARPSRDWLAHVRTGRARHQDPAVAAQRGAADVRRRSGRRSSSASCGAVGTRSSTDAELHAGAQALGLNDARSRDTRASGRVTSTSRSCSRRSIPSSTSRRSIRAQADRAGAVDRPDARPGTSKGLRIQGADGLMVRYAQCCQPVPGDPVVGYVTRGRGVSIHRADCPNLLHLVHEPERRLEIDWQEQRRRALRHPPGDRGQRPTGVVRRHRGGGELAPGPTSVARTQDDRRAGLRIGAGRGREPRPPARRS